MTKIIKGHDTGSCFWIMPVKVKDINKDTNDIENVIEFKNAEISIDEEDFKSYLFPIVLKFFNDNLDMNRKRLDVEKDEYTNGIETSFIWNLTNNYFTVDDIKLMIKEIEKIVYLLTNDYNNSYLDYVKKDYDWILYEDNSLDHSLLNNKKFQDELVEKNKDKIIKFYVDFNKFMVNMVNVAIENEYNLIIMCGP